VIKPEPFDTETKNYHSISLRKRIEFALQYFGLLSCLGVMTYKAHELLTRQLNT
jgi:hypothetical protein